MKSPAPDQDIHASLHTQCHSICMASRAQQPLSQYLPYLRQVKVGPQAQVFYQPFNSFGLLSGHHLHTDSTPSLLQTLHTMDKLIKLYTTEELQSLPVPLHHVSNNCHIRRWTYIDDRAMGVLCNEDGIARWMRDAFPWPYTCDSARVFIGEVAMKSDYEWCIADSETNIAVLVAQVKSGYTEDAAFRLRSNRLLILSIMQRRSHITGHPVLHIRNEHAENKGQARKRDRS